ncbi:MAG TPA: phosphomannomutase/phosphoglucomutase [Candidatus Nanoarchaeia archaeon]|nr:phosphomannomutase/phosphoglucomutase [Candidatus Nanoarchaeia archaeon]
MKIFQANDIRGIYGKELSDELAKKIGYAFQKITNAKKIIIARDNRLSSENLKNSFLYGIDAEIIDIGVVPVSLFYFVMNKYYSQDSGVMITASHLGKELNGFKFINRTNNLTYENGIKEIEDIAGLLINVEYKEKNIILKNYSKEYINWITKDIKVKKRLRIIIDSGNGIVGPYFIKALKKLKINYYGLHLDPDGRFPNHIANPMIKNSLEDIRREVVRKRASFGLAFDGDGDRVRLIAEDSEIIDNDFLLAMLSHSILLEKKIKVIYTNVCSSVVKDVVKMYKGKPILGKIGHSYIINMAKKEKVDLVGEFSGHFGFKENFYYDDGLYAGLRIIEMINKNRGFFNDLRELRKNYYLTDEIRIKSKNKMDIVKKLNTLLRNKRKSNFDGLKIYFKGGWALIRASNTEDLISFRAEAKDKAELKAITNLILSKIKKFA